MLNQLNLTIGVIANHPVCPHFPESSRPVGGTSLCLVWVHHLGSARIHINYKLSEVASSVTCWKRAHLEDQSGFFFFFAVLQTVLKCYRGLPDIPNGQYSPHYKKATFMCLLNLLFSSKVKHETRALLYHKWLWYPLPRGQHRCIIKVQKSKEIQNFVITIMNCI